MRLSGYLLLVFTSVFMLAGCNLISDVVRKKDGDVAALVGIEHTKYRIMGKGVASEEAMLKYLMNVNMTIVKKKAAYIVRTYIWESSYEGVNHDVAFVQMCHETNFLRFGGDSGPLQNNFCGLGTINSFNVGVSFPDIRTGIRAHIQHLKAYASSRALSHRCVDPRFMLIRRGSAHDVFALTGKWAKDPIYGKSLKKKIDALVEIERRIRLSKQEPSSDQNRIGLDY